MRGIRLVALLAPVILLCTIPLVAQECGTLQNGSSDDLVSYLTGILPDRNNAACMNFAINKLGSQRYEPAIDVLTRLLYFRWPPNVRQKQKLFVLEHDGFNIHPAATALEQIGKNALPAVLDAVKAGTNSRQSVEVAISVWMTIYNNQAPVGVMLLKQEADRTKDPATRQRVGWAAFKALNWCAPADLAQCKAALNTRYSN